MSRRKVLGLIPAKGGSTRLRRKNVLQLGNKPLLAWAAEAALESGVMDRIIVSTEDSEIAAMAHSLGLETPFVRPDYLARDPAGVVDVALHALQSLREQGQEYQTLVILLPTCPFRTAEDIRSAYQLFRDEQALFLMSVSQYEHTPLAALRLDANGYLHPYFPEYIGKKSQELPSAYRANGAIHVLDVPAFEVARSYYAEPLVGYVMSRERSIDIDTEEDLALAENVLRIRGSCGK